MFKVESLSAGYGAVRVLWDISFDVGEQEIVCILGGNGAGKTTIARSISGLIRPMSKSSIQLHGQELVGFNSIKILEAGIVQIPEGRQLFGDMTVFENLELGAYNKACKAAMAENLELVYKWFPRLKERTNQLAGTLSGGEQQMLAVGRGILSMPKLLLLDEPSLGLAPNIVDQIFEFTRILTKEKGISAILVEQDVHKALTVSDRGYVVENGKVVLADTAANLMVNEDVKKAYLGL